MENQLTYFIGLACHRAKLKGYKTLSQRVLEKMIVIARDNLRLNIENTETIIYIGGGMTILDQPTLAIYSQPVQLFHLKSKYFNNRGKHGRGVQFVATSAMESDLPKLSQQEYIPDYDRTIDELLEIYVKGKYDDLLFLSLLHRGDSGLTELIGDIEKAIRSLENIVRNKIYIGDAVSNMEKLREGIEAPLNQLLIKLSILRGRDERISRLSPSKGKGSATRYIILQKANCFSRDCLLWNLIERLNGIIRNAFNLSIEWISAGSFGPLFIKNGQVSEIREQVLEKFVVMNELLNPSGIKKEQQRYKSDSDAEAFVQVSKNFFNQMYCWIRALLGLYDPEYFGLYAAESLISRINKTIIVIDIKDSSGIKVRALGPNVKNDRGDAFNFWYEHILSIPRNWAILMGGTIYPDKQTAGDKVILFFDDPESAMWCAALAAYHYNMLDSITKEPFRYRAKIALGQDIVHISGGVPSVIWIDGVSKKIDTLAEMKLPHLRESSHILVDQDFYRKHETLIGNVKLEQIRDLNLLRIEDESYLIKKFLEYWTKKK